MMVNLLNHLLERFLISVSFLVEHSTGLGRPTDHSRGAAPNFAPHHSLQCVLSVFMAALTSDTAD